MRIGPILVAGDAISFLVFAAIGRGSHQEALGITALGSVAGTAWPFLVAWYVLAIPLGALDPALARQPRSLLVTTGKVWLLAWPCALVIRAIALRRGIPLSFALVVLVSNAVMLLGWRGCLGLAVRYAGRRSAMRAPGR